MSFSISYVIEYRIKLLEYSTNEIEALPGGGGGYLFPCSPEINWLVLPLFLKKSKICFLMFPVPQYCLCFPDPLKIWPLFRDPCFPEINALFLCSPKSWEGLEIGCKTFVRYILSKTVKGQNLRMGDPPASYCS